MERHGRETKENVEKKAVPDGGWGWMVVVGAGIFMFLCGGFIRSFSLIFEQLREKFGSSASATAWVYSIDVTSAYCAGPLSTMLSTRFSVRKVAMVANIFMFVGYFSSAFAPSLSYIYVSHCIAGIGKGLIYTPTLVIISEWFDKKRGKATSLGLMMDGFGSLALAPLVQLLFDHYGYSGTMLIVSGLMLNHCITAAFYRSPDKLDFKPMIQNDIDTEMQYLDSSSKAVSNSNGTVATDYSESKNSSDNTTTDTESEEMLNVESQNGEKYEKEFSKKNNTNIPTPGTHFSEEKAESKSFSDKIVQYFDYRLLAMGTYLTFSLLMSCASLCFSMCNTHIAGLAKERNLSIVQVSLLISLMGGVNTASKFLCGFFFDLKFVRQMRIHIFSTIGFLISVALVISPWIGDITMFYVVWLVFMVTVAVFTTQESLILADLVGRQRFPSAIGINRFFRGLGVLVGPTVGGFLKDYTGVYDYTFVFGGMTIMASVIIFEISVIISHRSRARTF